MTADVWTTLKAMIVKYLCQSLLTFKQYTYGDQIFQELFYDRTDAKNKVLSALSTGENMTVIGNPGEGKTCLMHYMFIEAAKSDDIYPIILDYRAIAPRDIYGIVAEFVSGITQYFTLKQLAFQ
jgi:DNA replication protein DnaC